MSYLSINGEVVFLQSRETQGGNPLPGEVAASNAGSGGAAEVENIVELRKVNPEFAAREEQWQGGKSALAIRPPRLTTGAS